MFTFNKDMYWCR